MKPYASDLSDAEWAILGPLIPPAKPGGRPRSGNMRLMLNGIFYVLRSRCPWRLLPHDYPAWSTVYDYVRKWRTAGVWERLVTTLRERLRVQAGREATPSGAIIDSQSVKTTERGGPHGYMAAKSSPDANGTCSSTRWDCCWAWSFTRPHSFRYPTVLGMADPAKTPFILGQNEHRTFIAGLFCGHCRFHQR